MFRQFFYQKHHKKASVLITCLWTLMILSILCMGLSGLIFQEIRFARTYQRIILSLPTARAALKNIFYLRQKDLTPAFDTFKELTEENELLLCKNNSYKYYLSDKNNINDKTEVIDEGALININIASTDVLARLPGMDEELANKLVNSGLRPFSSINEILLVEGMTKDNFLLFKDLVTIYGQGKININTASRGVLLALGLDEELVEAILCLRLELKIENPDPDSKVDFGYGFSGTDKILDELRKFTTLGLKQEQDFLALLPTFSVKSEYLRFNIIPYFAGKQGLHYSIIVHPATNKVLSWNEQ